MTVCNLSVNSLYRDATRFDRPRNKITQSMQFRKNP